MCMLCLDRSAVFRNLLKVVRTRETDSFNRGLPSGNFSAMFLYNKTVNKIFLQMVFEEKRNHFTTTLREQ